MEKILKIQNKNLEIIRFDWLNPIDVQLIADRIDVDQDIKNMILVHHETTTGRLNQLREIGQICRDNDIGLYLDGVSSFGAEDIKANEINLKAVAASANKCLHGAPGLAFPLYLACQSKHWRVCATQLVPWELLGLYFLCIWYWEYPGASLGRCWGAHGALFSVFGIPERPWGGIWHAWDVPGAPGPPNIQKPQVFLGFSYVLYPKKKPVLAWNRKRVFM